MDLLTCDVQYEKHYVCEMIKKMFIPEVSKEETVMNNLNTYLDITDAVLLLKKNFLGEVLEACQVIHSNGGLHNRPDSDYPLNRLLCIISDLATLRHKKILRRMLSWGDLEDSHKELLQKIINRLKENSLFERCFI